MEISYAIKDGKIVSANNKANSQYAKWLERQTGTIIDITTDDARFCSTSNLKYDGSTVILIPEEELKPALIEQCDAVRNRITEQTILEGFEYPPVGGVRFYMTAENQRNFAQLYQLSKDGLVTYPETVWSGQEEVSLADHSEVTSFYLAGVQFIKTALSEGKAVRDSFRTMTYTELKQWLADNQ